MPVSAVSKWLCPGQQSKSVTTQAVLPQHSSKMSAAEIALIVICSLVFVGGAAILSIFLAKFRRFLFYFDNLTQTSISEYLKLHLILLTSTEK